MRNRYWREVRNRGRRTVQTGPRAEQEFAGFLKGIESVLRIAGQGAGCE